MAEVICKIIKEDLETMVNSIRSKSTRKRKRDSTSDSVSEPSDTDKWDGYDGYADIILKFFFFHLGIDGPMRRVWDWAFHVLIV